MTNDRRITVLYVNHEDYVVGGSSRSLDNMLRSVKEYVNPVILLRSEGPVAEFFRSKGYECIIHNFRRLTYKGGVLVRTVRFIPHLVTNTYINHKCVEDVARLLKGRNINIVHSNSSVIDIGLALARKLGARHVWHIREYFDLGLKARPFLGFRRWKRKLEVSDAVIAISTALRDHLALKNNDRVFCLPDAVRSVRDLEFFKKKEKRFLFCAGELSEVKRPETAVSAFGRSGLAGKGYVLSFIGSCVPGRKSMLMSLARSYGVENQVEFLGYVASIEPLMSKATAYLMCSEFEGLGRVTIEAMFYGCPVIARRSGGTLEIIQDKVNGFFFDTEDECAGLMNMVASEMPEDVILAAQKEAADRFSEEGFGHCLLDIYHKILI